MGIRKPVTAGAIRHPFVFPHAGLMKTHKVEFGPMSPDEPVLEIAQGNSGVVRQLFLAAAGGASDFFWGLSYLKIYYGGEAVPSFDLSVGHLVGHPSTFHGGAAGTVFKSKWIEIVANNDTAGTTLFGLNCRIPIPYTDGIKIVLTDNDEGALTAFYSTALYQDQLPACWNRNYKLKTSAELAGNVVAGPGSEESGTITITGTSVAGSGTSFSADWIGKVLVVANKPSAIITARESTTAMTIDRNIPSVSGHAFRIAETLKFLDVAAGKRGALVMDSMGLDPASANWYHMEANPQFHVDRETIPSYEWSGMEDYLGGAYYFAGGELQGDHGGVTDLDTTDKKVRGYHIHDVAPVLFTDGIIGRWPNDYCASGEAIASAVTAYWGSMYYEED